MSHRIREAMRDDSGFVFGSLGGAVEVDETFIGRDPFKSKPRGGFRHKQKVLSLIDRDSGKARSMVIDRVTAKTIVPILKANIAREARVMTDGGGQYSKLSLHFYEHGMVNHETGEYVSMIDPSINTQTIESFFAVFKRGMKGVYQHCGHNHLNRYLSEFDFRYNNRTALGVNDSQRAENLLQGVVGKRLTYETTAG
jgi:transposase-like protein